VKSGASSLSPVERSLRDAVKEGRVRWVEYRSP
jgi:predicted Holliday junction resolvase-like endonuclease